MKTIGTFPSGQPIQIVKQTDCTPNKRVFVLGVYASAVHACWFCQNCKKPRITALAVASEPEIFWTGKGAAAIIAKIAPPNNTGCLEPADGKFNGPSGKTLDSDILAPLRISRADAWLCDLVPYSCMNPGQKKALKREGLPIPDWPEVPDCLADDTRRDEIRAELTASTATILITLGDKPLQFFAAPLFGTKRRLADYGDDVERYGHLHPVQLGDRQIKLLPLAHPRQIGRLGIHSEKWAALHETWMTTTKPRII